ASRHTSFIPKGICRFTTHQKANRDQLNCLIDGMAGFAETVDLQGVPVRTINLEGLLRTKRMTRDKGVADRTVLERQRVTFRRHSQAREPDCAAGPEEMLELLDHPQPYFPMSVTIFRMIKPFPLWSALCSRVVLR
ncbi:MAG: hypothetical protein KDI53_17130, partial [Candidatus Accumulibacter sp.]|nr:hypothetical protein [Accumulibacter sp.]